MGIPTSNESGYPQRKDKETNLADKRIRKKVEKWNQLKYPTKIKLKEL